MHEYTRLYIDGQWVEPSGSGTLDVIDSTTEERFATIPAGDPVDIDRAVAASKAAFPAWSERTGAERGKLLQRVADALEARRVNDGRGFRGAPFGGYKQSGLGRENGPYGFEEFLEVKALFV